MLATHNGLTHLATSTHLPPDDDEMSDTHNNDDDDNDNDNDNMDGDDTEELYPYLASNDADMKMEMGMEVCTSPLLTRATSRWGGFEFQVDVVEMGDWDALDRVVRDERMEG